jgi:Protein of unknown function (DUF2950)
MLEILGPDAKQIVSSGDPTEDAENRAKVARKYEEMHRFLKEPNGSVVMYIGAENWPFPIPLAIKGNLWFFDTEAGKKEVVFRRIGRNEYSAIRVFHELVAAQKEYYAMQHNEYAKKIFSDEGQHNGLYWTVSDSEPQSPIRPLVASAVHYHHATFFAITCIPRFSLSSNRGQDFTAFGAFANPCSKCQTLGIS